jgi:cytochrome d ubiquinol oxidase subunit I
MQTPAGYALENGKVVLTDVWKAVFNPSTIIRFIHVISAAWLTGAVLIAGIGAYYILKKKNEEFSKRLIKNALLPFIICSLLQAILGHTHIMEVREYQPIKSSAYEGIFTTTNGAPLYAFGIPDAKNRRINFAVGFPYMLSFLESGRFDSRVEGLDQFPESEWPPVNTVFNTFHLMVMIGVILIAAGLLGGLLFLLKKIYSAKWFLFMLVVLIPLPYLSNELGWMGTEIGRQPWTVYGLLKTSEASSTIVSSGKLTVSLILISAVYLFLLIAFIVSIMHMVRSGPGPEK